MLIMFLISPVYSLTFHQAALTVHHPNIKLTLINVTYKHTHFQTILAYQNARKLTYSNLEFPIFSVGGPPASPVSGEGNGGRGLEEGKEGGKGLVGVRERTGEAAGRKGKVGRQVLSQTKIYHYTTGHKHAHINSSYK